MLIRRYKKFLDAPVKTDLVEYICVLPLSDV